MRGSPGPPAEGLDRWLEEAVRVLELRRFRRMLAAGYLPCACTLGIFLAAGALILFLSYVAGSAPAGTPPPLTRFRGWNTGALWVACSLGAALAGWLRVTSLWERERRLRSYQSWLLSRQRPERSAATVTAMAALPGLGLSAIPAAAALAAGIVQGFAWWQLLLSLLTWALSAGVGAALGAASFFGGAGLLRRRWYYPGLLLLALLAAALWLRIEAMENGWRGGWEGHPERMARALMLLAPVTPLLGLSIPRWWHEYAFHSLGWSLPAWAAGIASLLLLLGCLAHGTWLGIRGYRRLANDPDAFEERVRAPIEEAGEEYYWQGFRNPVWTRDVRTRLRSSETAEFIFFSSITVAAGGFVPLLLAAGDLTDPLQSAVAARQVFFWLTMTLIALVSLVAPGLTAESITQERQLGTLEMLLGSPLRTGEILMGKLLGAICVLLVLISPSLPLFGLCYLFHGASGGQVAAVLALLVLTLAVCSLIGVTQSAINRSLGAAKFFAYACTAAYVAVPGGPFWIGAAAAAPDPATRQALMQAAGAAVLIGVLAAFILVLFWGNAREQLEYLD